MTKNNFSLTKILQHWAVYPIWIVVLSLGMIMGLAAGVTVFAKGLSVTGLTDAIPWGLWITLDLSSIAVSAGAFSLSAAVYILGIKSLRPLARVAVFVGLIGYSMAMIALILDIGRPDRFWHAMVFWNTHSVLWEVTMCVMLYSSVLVVEFMPLVGESWWMKKFSPRLAKLLAGLHNFAPALAIVGLCLSLLHQSSLGATYGIIKARPIWFKPDMSVLFILSAVAAGQSLTLLAYIVVNKLRAKISIERNLVENVAKFIGFTLLAYLYLRFWDFMAMNYTNMPGRDEGIKLLTNGVFQINFWLGEVVLGALVPATILLWSRTRKDDRAVAFALAMIVMGVVLYRYDTNLAGLMMMVSYTNAEQSIAVYNPTWVEWATVLGVVAYGLMAFTLGMKYLPVMENKEHEDHTEEVKKLTPSTVTA